METVIGIKFNDFVLIATDMTAAHSIMVMKDGETFIIILILNRGYLFMMKL